MKGALLFVAALIVFGGFGLAYLLLKGAVSIGESASAGVLLIGALAAVALSITFALILVWMANVYDTLETISERLNALALNALASSEQESQESNQPDVDEWDSAFKDG